METQQSIIKTPRRVDPAFSKEVKKRFGGETLTLCYQCGTCASSCPVAKITDRFNPRKLIKLTQLGARKEIISGEALWLCCSCYNCVERCPQGVEIADLIFTLRNIALEEGYIPTIYSEFIKALSKNGRLVEISRFMMKTREKYGLPELKPAGLDAIKRILESTTFDKVAEKVVEE
ncbi:MAG: heterodisulfide reductase [Thermotogae bacterium]|nr:MAG: heterodisulfide reductase [Thermotogota bacterium]